MSRNSKLIVKKASNHKLIQLHMGWLKLSTDFSGSVNNSSATSYDAKMG